ncbi:recombinase RecT [Pseudomonas fluorescens]|nr:recombinase RecT [Pseudomonas fluorescens]
MSDLAMMMSKGVTTVPKHLKGNQADCMAVVLQAMQWQMNPFAVAQETFIVNGGALSYSLTCWSSRSDRTSMHMRQLGQL